MIDIIEKAGNWEAQHRSKLAVLSVTTFGHMVIKAPSNIKYQAGKGNAVVFNVLSSDTDKFNCVFLHKNLSGVLSFWCGIHDKKTKQEVPFKEGPCDFDSRNNDGYYCKHMVTAAKFMERNKKEINSMLNAPIENNKKQEDFLKYWKNTLFFGPTGSGKTHLVRQALAGHKTFRINVTDGLEDVDLLHKLIPDPETKGWKRLPGELRQAFDAAKTEKVVVMLEEITRSTRSLRNLLIKAMDKEEGYYILHDFTVGEYIKIPAENLLFVATGNINHADTSELDPALARRFPMFLFNDYNTVEEKNIITKKIKDSDVVAGLIAIIGSIRGQYRAGRLPVPIDTGSIIEWIDLIEAGEDIIDAARMTWLYRVVEKDNQGYPEEGQVKALLELIEKKGVI